MPRYHLIIFSMASLVAIVICGCTDPEIDHEPATKSSRPNVLIIMVDDLRPELGCYGRTHIHSPNIDALAADGMLFERAYAQTAACTVSRASFMTGCYPNTTNVLWFDNTIPQGNPNLVTTPRHFRQNGYETISVGKVFHYGIHDDPQAWTREPWEPETEFPVYLSDAARHMTGIKEKLRGPISEAAGVPDEAYRDGKTAREAVKQLSRLKDSNKPFLMSVGFFRPHLPFNCPKKYWDLYPPDTIRLPENRYYPKNALKNGWHHSEEPRAYTGVPQDLEEDFSNEQMLNMIRGYYACTTYVDVLVGQIVDQLKQLDLYDNTVIVFWGDHGFHLGENDMFGKGTIFEKALRTPLIVKTVGSSTTGKRTLGLTDSVDILPSLCELCNLSIPEQAEGISFVPLLKKPDRKWAQVAYSQLYKTGNRPQKPNQKAYWTGYSIRTPQHRFICWRIGKGDFARTGEIIAVELYDHNKDPGENTNVAALPENNNLIRNLLVKLGGDWSESRQPPPL